MDRQNGVLFSLNPALVDHLLRAALDFRVAALHRVKVQVGRVGACGERAGRTAAHANAHAGAAKLNQQTARWEFNFLRLPGINHPQATRDHDRLVIPALNAAHGLLVLTEVAQQVRATKLVVESCAA